MMQSLKYLKIYKGKEKKKMQFIKYIFTLTRFFSIYLCASAIRNIIINKGDFETNVVTANIAAIITILLMLIQIIIYKSKN